MNGYHKFKSGLYLISNTDSKHKFPYMHRSIFLPWIEFFNCHECSGLSFTSIALLYMRENFCNANQTSGQYLPDMNHNLKPFFNTDSMNNMHGKKAQPRNARCLGIRNIHQPTKISLLVLLILILILVRTVRSRPRRILPLFRVTTLPRRPRPGTLRTPWPHLIALEFPRSTGPATGLGTPPRRAIRGAGCGGRGRGGGGGGGSSSGSSTSSSTSSSSSGSR